MVTALSQPQCLPPRTPPFFTHTRPAAGGAASHAAARRSAVRARTAGRQAGAVRPTLAPPRRPAGPFRAGHEPASPPPPSCVYLLGAIRWRRCQPGDERSGGAAGPGHHIPVARAVARSRHVRVREAPRGATDRAGPCLDGQCRSPLDWPGPPPLCSSLNFLAIPNPCPPLFSTVYPSPQGSGGGPGGARTAAAGIHEGKWRRSA